MSERGRALVTHYHETYELTYRFWKERNRAFLMLITTLAIAALISYEPRTFTDPNWQIPRFAGDANLTTSDSAGQTGAQASEGMPQRTRNTFVLTALCYYFMKEGDGKGCGPKSEMMTNLIKQFRHYPFDGIISIIVLYLMLNITNLSSTISRYYGYINRMEREVREEFAVGRWKVAFSREGGWYEGHRGPLQFPIRYFYVVLLTVMLGFYFLVRIASELHPGGNAVLLAIHAVIAALCGVALYGYASLILGWTRLAAPDDA